MDRLKAMRQRDWMRLFGFACAGGAVVLSVAGYSGAQWDALILALGALMLLRGAVEQPAAGLAAQLIRALRLILFMFAFAAVNGAQGGIEGAVTAALGNGILWAVAALLLSLPLFRKRQAASDETHPARDLALLAVTGALFWLLFRWLEGAGDMAQFRTLVATAAVANAAPVWQTKGQPVLSGITFALVLVCAAATPGATLWPVALAVLPVGLAAGWARRT